MIELMIVPSMGASGLLGDAYKSFVVRCLCADTGDRYISAVP